MRRATGAASTSHIPPVRVQGRPRSTSPSISSTRRMFRCSARRRRRLLFCGRRAIASSLVSWQSNGGRMLLQPSRDLRAAMCQAFPHLHLLHHPHGREQVRCQVADLEVAAQHPHPARQQPSACAVGLCRAWQANQAHMRSSAPPQAARPLPLCCKLRAMRTHPRAGGSRWAGSGTLPSSMWRILATCRSAVSSRPGISSERPSTAWLHRRGRMKRRRQLKEDSQRQH